MKKSLKKQLKEVDEALARADLEGDMMLQFKALEVRKRILLNAAPLAALPFLRTSDEITTCRPLETMQAMYACIEKK